MFIAFGFVCGHSHANERIRTSHCVESSGYAGKGSQNRPCRDDLTQSWHRDFAESRSVILRWVRSSLAIPPASPLEIHNRSYAQATRRSLAPGEKDRHSENQRQAMNQWESGCQNRREKLRTQRSALGLCT